MLRWPEIGFEEIAVDLPQARGDLLGASPARILFVSARFRCSTYGIWDFCALRFFAATLHKPAAPDEVFPGHRPVTGHPSSDIRCFGSRPERPFRNKPNSKCRRIVEAFCSQPSATKDDCKPVYRYLCGETSQKPTSGPVWLLALYAAAIADSPAL